MNKNFWSGILILSVGIFFKIYSLSYKMGEISNMGPGYFPNLISTCLVLLGIIILIKHFLWKS
jgi:hypothetical protein